jgi:hypothetical protein
MWSRFGLVTRCSLLLCDARFARFGSNIGRTSATPRLCLQSWRGALRGGALTWTQIRLNLVAPRESSVMPPTHYVLLCRHGETASTGPTREAPLSKAGRRQAHQIGRRLAETFALDDAFHVSAVWCGSHQAALETEGILRSEIGREDRNFRSPKHASCSTPSGSGPTRFALEQSLTGSPPR